MLCWVLQVTLYWILPLFFIRRILIDDGTPRLPIPFRVQLSLTVMRLKQMIEEQEGFAISEQKIFFRGSEVRKIFDAEELFS